MARRAILAASLIIVVTPLANGVAQSAQSDTADLLRLLNSKSIEERSRGVLIIGQSPELQADPRIRADLIGELARVNQARHERYSRWSRGEQLGVFEEPHGGYDLALVSAVARLRDPNAIPALVNAADTGALVARALADFGDLALPAVLARWHGRTLLERAELSLLASGLLRALNAMSTSGSLDPAERTQVLSVAREALQRPRSAIELQAAIDMSVALRDSELVADVEKMTFDVGEMFRRGITDVDTAERVQRAARSALAKLK